MKVSWVSKLPITSDNLHDFVSALESEKVLTAKLRSTGEALELARSAFEEIELEIRALQFHVMWLAVRSYSMEQIREAQQQSRERPSRVRH